MPTIRELHNVVCPEGHMIETVKVIVPDPPPPPPPGWPPSREPQQVEVTCPKCRKGTPPFKATLK